MYSRTDDLVWITHAAQTLSNSHLLKTRSAMTPHKPTAILAFMPDLSFLALQVHLLSTSNPSKAPQLVQSRIAGLEYFISHHEGQLLILSNAHGAVNYQLMTTSVHQPSLSHWRTLVPEREGVALRDLEIFATHAVLYESHGMNPAVSVLSLPACSETASLLPQRQVDPPVHAGSQACADDQQGSCGDQQAGQAETQLHEHGAPVSHTQQTNHQQQSRSMPCEQRLAQQQLQTHPEPDVQQQFSVGKKQQRTRQYPQQHRQQQHCHLDDQQLLQSVPGYLQTIAISPWVTSIEAGANLDYHSTTVRLKMASPVHSQHVYDYHLDSEQLHLLAAAKVEGHDPEEYTCQVHYAVSHDNTQVWQVSQPAKTKNMGCRNDQWTD